jgi:hypothetical protein
MRWGVEGEADREQAIAEHKWADGTAYQLSYVYAARNDVEHSIYWLERAYQQHDSGLLSIKHDPMLTNVEHDLRYKALLRKDEAAGVVGQRSGCMGYFPA